MPQNGPLSRVPENPSLWCEEQLHPQATRSATSSQSGVTVRCPSGRRTIAIRSIEAKLRHPSSGAGDHSGQELREERYLTEKELGLVNFELLGIGLALGV